MFKTLSSFTAALLIAAVLGWTGAARAGNTYFLTDKNGQVLFPLSPPSRATGAPGAIDNMTIGGTTQAPLGASTLKVDSGTKTAAATAGAATLNKNAGVITTESLTTAAAGVYTLTLTDSQIAAADVVQVTIGNGTNTTGLPVLSTVKPAAGSAVIVIANLSGAAAFNGTLIVMFTVIKN